MAVTIGLVGNMYQEANALPGWLETHLPFFDDVRVLHAGPQGEYSDDGTIELLERWQVPVEFCAIDDGFGAVRTRALRMSPCDWVMLLDADERFYPLLKCIEVSGEATPQNEVDWILQQYDFRGVRLPNWENIARLGDKLRVEHRSPFDQGGYVRGIISEGIYDAIRVVRRHWHDLKTSRPTQNWYNDPDWQMRLVRNSDSIYFTSETRMHERLVGTDRTWAGGPELGPFFDHFHFTFKRMEERQRAHDVAVYDAIHAGARPPTRKEFEATNPVVGLT